MTVPWSSMEPTSKDLKLVVRCTPGGAGQCVLRGPPWSMQVEQQGPSTTQKEGLVTPSACQKHLSTSPQTPQPLKQHYCVVWSLKHMGHHQHHSGIFYRPTCPASSATPTPNCLFSLSLLSTPVLTGGAWSTMAT